MKSKISGGRERGILLSAGARWRGVEGNRCFRIPESVWWRASVESGVGGRNPRCWRLYKHALGPHRRPHSPFTHFLHLIFQRIKPIPPNITASLEEIRRGETFGRFATSFFPIHPCRTQLNVGIRNTEDIIKESATTTRYNKNCVALGQCKQSTRSIIPLLIASGNNLAT